MGSSFYRTTQENLDKLFNLEEDVKTEIKAGKGNY